MPLPWTAGLCRRSALTRLALARTRTRPRSSSRRRSHSRMPLCVAHTTQRQKVVEKVRFFWIVKPIVGNDMMNVEFVPERLLGRSAVPTLVRVSLSRKPPLSFPVAAPIIKRVATLPGGRCFAGQVLCPPFPVTDMRAEGAVPTAGSYLICFTFERLATMFALDKNRSLFAPSMFNRTFLGTKRMTTWVPCCLLAGIGRLSGKHLSTLRTG